MKSTFFLTFVFCMNIIYTQISPIYGIYYSHGTPGLDFIRLDPETGNFIVVSTLTEMDYVCNGTSSLNEGEDEYFIQLIGYDSKIYLNSIDINTGSVNYIVELPERIRDLQYSCHQDNLFGFWNDGEIQHLVTINKETGEKTIVESYPDIDYINEQTGSMDDVNGRMMAVGKPNGSDDDIMYVFDLSDGTIVSETIVNGLYMQFLLNCNDGLYYGLAFSGSTVYWTSLNVETGEKVYIHPYPELISFTFPTAAIIPNENVYIVQVIREGYDDYMYSINILTGETFYENLVLEDPIVEFEPDYCCDPFVSINTITHQNKLIISPNPASNIINFNINNAKEQLKFYYILNTLGEIVITGQVNNTAVISSDISDLIEGIYLVYFEGTDQIITEKFIIE